MSKKKRASKYEKKLIINASFGDVIGFSVKDIKVKPKKKKKPSK